MFPLNWPATPVGLSLPICARRARVVKISTTPSNAITFRDHGEARRVRMIGVTGSSLYAAANRIGVCPGLSRVIHPEFEDRSIVSGQDKDTVEAGLRSSSE